MSRSRIFIITALILFGLASASGATDKITCNANGRTYQVTPGTWPLWIIAMWDKTSTDCDIIVDDGDGNTIALGIGIESRFEQVSFGWLPGVPVRITFVKAGGPNSKTYVRGADSSGFFSGYIPSSSDVGLRYLGTAKELARKDPAYAKVLAKWQRLRDLKSPSPSD